MNLRNLQTNWTTSSSLTEGKEEVKNSTRDRKIFSKIISFVAELNGVFGSKQHSLQLYNRYLSTKVNSPGEIRTHIYIFGSFLEKNSEALISKDASKLKEPNIVFTKKLNIKIREIFKQADADTRDIIWNHLLVISATIDPSAEKLKTIKDVIEEKSPEGEFVQSIFSTISKSIGQNTDNPMNALMGLMTSGDLPKMMTTMNDQFSSGNLNMEKLFGSVQTLFTSLGTLEPKVNQHMHLTENTEEQKIDDPLNKLGEVDKVD